MTAAHKEDRKRWKNKRLMHEYTDFIVPQYRGGIWHQGLQLYWSGCQGITEPGLYTLLYKILFIILKGLTQMYRPVD